MEDKKIELLERLIKENKISLKEAMILLEKEQTVVPFKTITVPHYDKDPFTVTCDSYPIGTTVTFTT